MTRVLSYNILMGATRRVNQVASIISAANPDIVGLVEAYQPGVVKKLAEQLGMQAVMNSEVGHSVSQQVALLTRLPIISTQVHIYSDRLTRPLLEVCVEEPGGEHLTIFVVHLSAAFSQKRAGDSLRRREIREILRVMSARQGTPHLVMGDFNTMAPGDPFEASKLLHYIVQLDERYQSNTTKLRQDGHPHLNFVVPASLRLFKPLLRFIAKNKPLSTFFNVAASFYAPRGTIAMIRSAGYVDCFRSMNPYVEGFTCPSAAPAGRIDFIFASPELASQLSRCVVMTDGDGVKGEEASDHLAVVADFGVEVRVEEGQGREVGREMCGEEVVR